MLYIRISCFVVPGCVVSRNYINVAIVIYLVLLMTISGFVLCVLMVVGMSVVVNVMLSLMSVINPHTSATYRLARWCRYVPWVWLL